MILQGLGAASVPASSGSSVLSPITGFFSSLAKDFVSLNQAKSNVAVSQINANTQEVLAQQRAQMVMNPYGYGSYPAYPAGQYGAVGAQYPSLSSGLFSSGSMTPILLLGGGALLLVMMMGHGGGGDEGGGAVYRSVEPIRRYVRNRAK